MLEEKYNELLCLINLSNLYRELLPVQGGFVDFEFYTHSYHLEGCDLHYHKRKCTVKINLRNKLITVSYKKWYNLFHYYCFKITHFKNNLFNIETWSQCEVKQNLQKYSLTSQQVCEIVNTQLAENKFKKM